MTYLTKEHSIEFEEDKTLYHYTSVYTAIEHIFPSSRLRLAPLTSASDPMEHTAPNPSISSYGYDEDIQRLQKNINGARLTKSVNDFYKSLRQLCLCRNAKVDFASQYTGVFEPIEHFGFAKPRMWDQYGDGYKGVCIALSRSKFEEQLPQEYEMIDIEYSKNHLLRPNIDTSSVDLNLVEKLGEEEYLKSKYKAEIGKIGTKHSDYRDENECKVIVASESEFPYVDITTSIQGIFVTNKLNYTYETWLKEIACDYKIPLIRLSIKRTGIDIYTIGN